MYFSAEECVDTMPGYVDRLQIGIFPCRLIWKEREKESVAAYLNATLLFMGLSSLISAILYLHNT